MSSLPDWIRCYPDYHCGQSAVVHMPFACRPVAWWAQRTGTRSAETVAVAAFALPIESGRSRPPSAALHSRQLPPRPGRTNLEFLRLYFKHREPSSMKFDAVYIYTSFPKSQSSLSCYQKKLVKNQWDNFSTSFLWDFQKKKIQKYLPDAVEYMGLLLDETAVCLVGEEDCSPRKSVELLHSVPALAMFSEEKLFRSSSPPHAGPLLCSEPGPQIWK